MKLKTTILTLSYLTLSAFSFSSQAAHELTPEKAEQLKPFERIEIRGRFNAISDANKAVAKLADQKGAAAFYIQNISDVNGHSGNQHVVADLYHADAPAISSKTRYRYFSGVKELPKEEATALEPFDTLSLRGMYRSQPEVNQAVAKEARVRGAASFFIARQMDINNGGNQSITALLYKSDAKQRQIQSPDAIPYESDAGKVALAAGGEQAKRVERPGVASSSSTESLLEHSASSPQPSIKRYTVRDLQGRSIQEVNATTAAQMQPFDSIKFTESFNSPTEVSEAVGRRAIQKGAKYYHITRQWANNSGKTLTVTADLFK